MNDPETFLSRWSRRKRASLQHDSAAISSPSLSGEGVRGARGGTALPQPPDPQLSPTPGEREGGPMPAPTELAFDPASLPPIESITAETDVRAFLAPGVPAELTRAALRRTWTCDPQIRNFVGLADYDWDFNAAGAVAGFGPLPATDEIGKIATRIVELNRASEDAGGATNFAPTIPTPETEAGPTPETEAGRVAPAEADNRATPMKSAGMAQSDDIARHVGTAAAKQHENAKPETPNTVRHRHGGALPK